MPHLSDMDHSDTDLVPQVEAQVFPASKLCSVIVKPLSLSVIQIHSAIKECSVVVQKLSKEEILYHCKPCFVLVKPLPKCDVAKLENVKNNIKNPGKGKKSSVRGNLTSSANFVLKNS